VVQAERPTIFQQQHLSSEQSKTNSIEIESCSIRILKSAIYHAFRCQIASTLIVREPPEGGHRRAASSKENRIWDWMCRDERLTGYFQPIKRSVVDSRRFRNGRPTRVSVKEVIQPQVPLRLPCYDFAPVTALAFGRLLWLPSCDTDFGRSQLPWRDGRCVQGPGTYSPWRC
jgi:hypothetical protein